VLQLNPRWKFLFQYAAAFSALAFGFYPDSFELPSRTVYVLPSILAAILTVLFIIFMMNAYNFMDGMDGQAGLFGLIAALGLAYPLARHTLLGGGAEAPVLGILAGTLCALLLHNAPGAPSSKKTFMGDSGSQFVGYLLAIFALHSEEVSADGFSFIAALILLAPFWWDVCYTLVRRMLRHENILQAHRSHLYQRLMIAGWSHGRTLAFNACLWLVCLWFAQFYAMAGRMGSISGRWAVLLATFLVLVAYTVFIRLVELTAQKTS
jgi:UDP-N-acetylmuramyl pentapeptide phosphotransferase/UDP-N-acetylglucosamine-1-phosphate transferase